MIKDRDGRERCQDCGNVMEDGLCQDCEGYELNEDEEHEGMD